MSSTPSSQQRSNKLPLVALISGRGSNLQAVIDAAASGELAVEIRAVISNRADAGGLERATRAGIQTAVLNHKDYDDRESYDAELTALIESFEPKLVILAGFMRILTAPLVEHFHGRLMNIHPSLLPKYRGLHTHERALEAGDKQHGASVHFVTPDLDAGPLVVQAEVPITENDTADELAARVLKQEHVIYPMAISWFADGRLRMDNGHIWLNNERLVEPVLVKA
jgi:phosphoribosylglycinamide formyltransferase-1